MTETAKEFYDEVMSWIEHGGRGTYFKRADTRSCLLSIVRVLIQGFYNKDDYAGKLSTNIYNPWNGDEKETSDLSPKSLPINGISAELTSDIIDIEHQNNGIESFQDFAEYLCKRDMESKEAYSVVNEQRFILKLMIYWVLENSKNHLKSSAHFTKEFAFMTKDKFVHSKVSDDKLVRMTLNCFGRLDFVTLEYLRRTEWFEKDTTSMENLDEYKYSINDITNYFQSGIYNSIHPIELNHIELPEEIWIQHLLQQRHINTVTRFKYLYKILCLFPDLLNDEDHILWFASLSEHFKRSTWYFHAHPEFKENDDISDIEDFSDDLFVSHISRWSDPFITEGNIWKQTFLKWFYESSIHIKLAGYLSSFSHLTGYGNDSYSRHHLTKGERTFSNVERDFIIEVLSAFPDNDELFKSLFTVIEFRRVIVRTDAKLLRAIKKIKGDEAYNKLINLIESRDRLLLTDSNLIEISNIFDDL